MNAEGIMEPNDNENIHDIGADAASKAENARARAGEAAQRTADKVGSQMKNFADKIRGTGPKVESTIHSTAERLAEKLERGGAYFSERQYEGTTRKVTDYIRQNPGKSMIVGLIAGLFLALKRRH
jgi:ElaB/YqjD/DUF883 family membrane-anchored ribosome-binding protein